MSMSVTTAIVSVLSFSLAFVHGKFFLRQPGDFIVGQVIQSRKNSGSSKCIEFDAEKIIEFEALVYSVKKIKENMNINIGYDIVDACSGSGPDTRAQLEFATRTWFGNEANISHVPVAIIEDLEKESDYLFLATEVHVFTKQKQDSLPLISLKPRERYWPDAYSMSPEKSTPSRAIVELAKYFQWNILDAVLLNEYQQLQNFKKISKDNGVCLLNELFASETDAVEATEWLRKGKSNASVIIVFASQDKLPRFVRKLDRFTTPSRDFVLGFELTGIRDHWKDSMEGLLGIQRDFGNLKDFEDYLSNSEHLETLIKKTACVNNSSEDCEHSKHKRELIKKLSWRGSPIIDAVYAAIDARQSGSNRLPKTGLAGIRFTSPTGRKVSFDQDEYINDVAYKVWNIQKRKIEKVGEIEMSAKAKLAIEKGNIVWRSSQQPRSKCSADCPPGTRRKAWDDSLAKCCWDCIRCEPGTVSSFVNWTRCLKCPTGSKPTSDQTKCQPPYVDYLRWHEPFSLVMIFILAFTICFLVYAVNLYVKKVHTPAFARSKCASLPLLLSLFVTFVLPVLLLMKPTQSSCSAYNAIFVLALGIPLTFLIARSHVLYNYCYTEGGRLKRKWFCFNPQTVVSLVLIIVQLIFVVIHQSVAPVKVLTFNTTEPDVEYIECSSHSRPEFLPLVFLILILIMVFNILHMNEIASPDDHGEVKFLSMAVFFMYSIIFIYFVAVYGVLGKKKIRVMCTMSFLLGLNFLASIFLPKIHVILFRPEENLPEVCPLLRDDDQRSKPVRLIRQECADSPMLGLRSNQYDRTEV